MGGLSRSRQHCARPRIVVRRNVPLAIVTLLMLLACTGPDQGSPAAQQNTGSRVASTVADCPDPPIPPGIYAKTIHLRDPGARRFSIAGRWTWGAGVADPNCVYESWFVFEVHGEVVFVDAHPYTLGPNGTLVFHGAQEPAGRYHVSIHGDRVILTVIRGRDWPTRTAVQTINPWILQESA